MVVGGTRVFLYSVLCVCIVCVCVCVCIEFVHKCAFTLMCVRVVCTIHTFIYSSLCTDINIYVYTHAYEYKGYRHTFSTHRGSLGSYAHTNTQTQVNNRTSSNNAAAMFSFFFPIYIITKPRSKRGSNFFLFCSYIYIYI